MKKHPHKIIFWTILILFILANMSIFYINENHKAVKFRLGEIIKSDFQPGIYFKMPIINTVKKFDARVLTHEFKPYCFLTRENKNIIVVSFVKWQIDDTKLFPTQANIRLDRLTKDVMQNEFSLLTIKQLVSENRTELRRKLMNKLLPAAQKIGIELIDVRIKRIDLPCDSIKLVYNRMKVERKRVARIFRSQGSQEAELIRAKADKKKEIILASAYKRAEIIRGRGDAKAAQIYAKSFGKNKEFYELYRNATSYKNHLPFKAN